MPTFDIVSEVDNHELSNAVDQANRELENRFDFRGVEASFELKDLLITLSAPSDFQVQQMLDILHKKLVGRGIDLGSIEEGEIDANLAKAKQVITVKQGIEQPLAKQVTAKLKEAKLKVTAQINGDKVRVQGKKRDDLQAAIALLKQADFEQPLQFENFRD